MSAGNFHQWVQWGMAIAVLSASLATSACSHRTIKADFKTITTPPILTQSVLAKWDVRPFSLTQFVRGTSQNTNYQAHFEIEWKHKTLTIVALTPAGLPIFIIQASATDTQVQSFIPPSDEQVLMDSAWVLSDFLLAMAPVGLLQQSLSDPALHLLSITSRERQLNRGDTPAIRISYSEQKPFSGQVELTNLELEYRLYVDTLHMEQLTP